MDIKLYICEGEPLDSSSIYIPDFTHHDQNPLLHPKGSHRETIQSLQAQGYSLLKAVDITPQVSIEDKNPINRYLLVFGDVNLS